MTNSSDRSDRSDRPGERRPAGVYTRFIPREELARFNLTRADLELPRLHKPYHQAQLAEQIQGMLG